MRGIRTLEALVATLTIIGCSRVLNIESGDGGTPPDGGTPSDGGVQGSSVVAANLKEAAALAVDGTYVYFTRATPSGAILRVAKAGGAPEEVAVGDLVSMPFAVAVGQQGPYWAAAASGGRDAGVRRLGSTIFTAQAPGAPGGLAVTVSKVFWTVPDTNLINSSDSTLVLVLPPMPVANRPTFIEADSTHLYYATVAVNGSVTRSLHDSSSPDTTSSIYDTISALALSSTMVAWASKDGVFRASLDLQNVTTVSSVKDVVGIAIDGAAGALYFVTGSSPGTIYRSTELSVPVAVLGPTCTQGRAIAQDADAVYVACTDAILRLAKVR